MSSSSSTCRLIHDWAFWANVAHERGEQSPEYIFFSKYNRNCDLLWCKIHKRVYLSTVIPPKENDIDPVCRVCPRFSNLNNIIGYANEQRIEALEKEWQTIYEQIRQISMKGQDTTASTIQERERWLLYEASIYELGLAIRNKYFQEGNSKKGFYIHPLIRKYQTNWNLRFPTGTNALLLMDTGSNPTSRSMISNTAKLSNPLLRWCNVHDTVGHGIPLQDAGAYNTECYMCLVSKHLKYDPIREQEDRERNRGMKENFTKIRLSKKKTDDDPDDDDDDELEQKKSITSSMDYDSIPNNNNNNPKRKY